MTTLVLSDLHLGRRDRRDLLRRPARWEPLLSWAAEAERVVLLGDVVELRHGPMAEALEAARPFLQALGAAVGTGAEVVLVPGNHDHRLLAGWHERRRWGGAAPLRLQEHVPVLDGEPASLIARWLAPASLTVAYPGVWLRRDVYATHGHYLDVHSAVPTLERLALGALERVAPSSSLLPGAERYEAAVTPLYATLHELAQRAPRRRRELPLIPGRALRGPAGVLSSGRTDRPPRLTSLGPAYPVVVAALAAAGVRPLRAVRHAADLAAAGVAAMATVCERLQIPAAHVVFGHLHRAGPLPALDAPRAWTTRAGVRLLNTGSWVIEEGLLKDDAGGAYWPGTCVEVPAEGTPRVVRVLQEGALAARRAVRDERLRTRRPAAV